MAILASTQSGNFTTASTWAVVDPVSYSASEAANTLVGTTFLTSATFIPGAITIDGIGIRILQTATIPVGTITVRLIQGAIPVPGTSVTINTTDVSNGTNSMGGWVFFKFNSPVTLLAATSYGVQVATSTGAQITIYRTSTANDWSRFLRTTTTQAPAATDTLIVSGEYTGPGTSNTITVTMNNTAIINFANIDVAGRGILQFATAPSTAYSLRLAGTLFVTGQGSLTVGTSSNPMPVSSSAAIRFVNTTNVDFGMQIRGTANVETFGASKITKAYLAVDRFFGATSLTTDISTGWLAADDIAIASTSTTVSQTEERSLVANAVGTNFDISSGLGFPHSGTNPTRAEIINLTRNVRILGTSTTLQTYVTNIEGARATVSLNFTELRFMGSATANRRGVDVWTNPPGTYTINGCSFRNFEAASSTGIILGTSVANATITNCVFYRMNTQAVQFSSSAQASVSVTDCWAMVNITAGNALFNYSSALPTLTGIVAVSATGAGLAVSTNDIATSNLISDITAHTNTGGGVTLTANSQMSTPPVISNLILWRNATVNLRFNNCQNLVVDTVNTFGSTIANIDFSSNISVDVALRNVTCNGGVSPAAADGIRIATSCDRINVYNSSFGVTTVHPIADINSTIGRGFLGINFYNCEFGSPNEVFGLNTASYNSYITFSKYDGISGEFRTFTPLGRITKDYIIFDTTNLGLSASTRLTPSSIASKLTSDKIIAVPNGRQLKVTVGIRTSVIGDGAAYNGALPQLVVKKNYAIGLTTDTVLATATVASSGAFEFITGTSPVATDNGAFTFCVTCDGTTGFVNVDSWIVEVI